MNLGCICSEVDAIETTFKKPADWITELYSKPNGGLDRSIRAYFTETQEFVDPTKPSKGFTGEVLFTITERIKSMESIQRQVENAFQNDYFEKFGEILSTCGKVISMGDEIHHSIR